MACSGMWLATELESVQTTPTVSAPNRELVGTIRTTGTLSCQARNIVLSWLLVFLGLTATNLSLCRKGTDRIEPKVMHLRGASSLAGGWS